MSPARGLRPHAGRPQSNTRSAAGHRCCRRRSDRSREDPSPLKRLPAPAKVEKVLKARRIAVLRRTDGARTRARCATNAITHSAATASPLVERSGHRACVTQIGVERPRGRPGLQCRETEAGRALTSPMRRRGSGPLRRSPASGDRCAAGVGRRVAAVVGEAQLLGWARVTDEAKCRRQERGLSRGLSSLSDLSMRAPVSRSRPLSWTVVRLVGR